MRRVQRDATKDELIKNLCDPKTGVFTEIWRLLLFAALLGKARNKREPLKQVDGSKSFPASYFSASPVWPGIIHLLALAEGSGPESLKAENWDESLRIFEEYANGGLSLLQGHDSLFSSQGISQFIEGLAPSYGSTKTSESIDRLRL